MTAGISSAITSTAHNSAHTPATQEELVGLGIIVALIMVFLFIEWLAHD